MLQICGHYSTLYGYVQVHTCQEVLQFLLSVYISIVDLFFDDRRLLS